MFTHPLTYSARFNVFVGQRGYRCQLELESVNDRWQAHDFKVRPLTRAEWGGPRTGGSDDKTPENKASGDKASKNKASKNKASNSDDSKAGS